MGVSNCSGPGVGRPRDGGFERVCAAFALMRIYINAGAATMASPAGLYVSSARKVGYSLFVLFALFALISPVDLLSPEVSDGFLVLPGFEVDDLARLSVT